LKSKRSTLEEQREMKAILERERLASASEASHVESLAQNGSSPSEMVDEDELLELAALDLNDPNWMSQLSAATLAKFHQVITSGALDEVLHPWIPWWYRDFLTPKIMVMENESADEAQEGATDETEEISLEPAPSPPLLSPIPSIKSLTTVTPSLLLANHAVEMLYAYAYTKRMFNGDWEEENCSDAVEMVIILSSVLRDNMVYKDLKDACRRPLECSIVNPETFVSATFSTSVLDDVLKLVSHGSEFLIAAFSEMHDTFLAAMRLNSENPPPLKKPKVTISQMQKKLLFMIAWANECSQPLLETIKTGIQLFIAESQQLPSALPEDTSTPSILHMTEPKKAVPKAGPKIEVLK
jgi:hypothetical protein